MKTGNFFNTKGLDKLVAISRGTPKLYKGEREISLAPTWEMLKRNYDQDEYVKKVLSKLNPNVIYEKYQDNIMLCWEKLGDVCHRHWLAEWIECGTGEKVEEYLTPRQVSAKIKEEIQAVQEKLF